MNWEVESTAEYDRWFLKLSTEEQKRVVAGVEALSEAGPSLGRPLVDNVRGSKHSNMKELRRGTLRVLFAFDSARTAVLLVGGDKRGNWKKWYVAAIARADPLFDAHLRRIRTKKTKKR